MNMTNVGPDRNDPFPNRSFADIVTSVEEAPTGRFMVSVGANSFQGLIGSIRSTRRTSTSSIPRSFSDIANGQAFRGGGQELRINLQAGTLINLMQVSLREPYLFDLPIGAGGSGYLFQRIYPNWDERRGGGSVHARPPDRHQHVRRSRGLRRGGRLLRLSFARSGRLPGGQRLDPAVRHQAQPAVSTTATTRSCRPRGSTCKFSVEQGFGSFTLTKFDAKGGCICRPAARPDGTGKQFFTLRGHFGDRHRVTPVYERFFAGNFGSFRGFQYRTVSPHAFGVPTGGFMMTVGSVEYQFPWNARDTFNQIFFTDFGTVTGNYQFNDMRISVGTGLKVVIPMMVRCHSSSTWRSRCCTRWAIACSTSISRSAASGKGPGRDWPRCLSPNRLRVARPPGGRLA